MFKKILIFLGIVFFFSGLLFHSVVYSRWFPAVALNGWFKYAQADIHVKNLSYRARRTTWNSIEFDDLKLLLAQGEETWDIDLIKLKVDADPNFWSSEKNITVHLDGPKITRGPLEFIHPVLTLEIKPTKVGKDVSGQLSGESLAWGDSQIQNLSSRIGGSTEAVTLSEFSADAYGGRISGEILLEFLSVVSYDISLDLTDIDLKRLQKVNQGFFSQFDGTMNGSVQVKSQGGTLENFSGDFELGEDGQVNPKFLNFFTQYMPDAQKNLLEAAIAKGENLPIRQANLKLKNVGSNKLAFNVDLDSSVVNLQDSTVDINLDAPIMSLLQLLEILKQLKVL